MTLSAGLAVASRSLGRLMLCNPCSSRLHIAGTPAQVFRQITRAAGKPAELPWIASGMGNGGKGGGRRSIRVASGGSDGAGNAGSGGLWGSYLAALESSPMLTRCITCAVLNGIGDIFCQLFVEGKEFSAKRCATFTLLGLAYVGPILTMWYGALGSMVTAPGTMGVIISLLVDQFLFAPAFIASFMSVMCLIEGDPNKIVPKLKQDLPEALKVNWMLWIPAQFINFQFVPPNLRTLAVNIVALLWNVYMSYQGHKVVAATPEAALAAPVLAATKGKGRK